MTKFLSILATIGLLIVAGCSASNNTAQPGNITDQGSETTPSGGLIEGQQPY